MTRGSDDFRSFASDYFEARRRFRKLCVDRGLTHSAHISPVKGPGGEELSIDMVRVGPDDAEICLVLTSGVHGVEGLCGSGCQIDWLRNCEPDELPRNLAVVLVHFLNPHGGAWVCVETEDNIDLNRNFLGFSEPLPVHEAYEDLHEALMCPERAGPIRDKAEEAIRSYIESKGLGAFLDVAARGQYTHPEGFNFGGQGPAWSNTASRMILASQLKSARRVALVDYHSGLGPYGHGTVIFDGSRGETAGRRVSDWYGPDVAFLDNAEIGYTSTGVFSSGGLSDLQCDEATGIVLEFGTWEIMRIADAMRMSFWLHRFGAYDSTEGETIRNELRDAFFVEAPDWQERLVERSREVIAQSIDGLQS